MSIYTKTGDRGTTLLYGGKKILKSDLQVETYGTIDELSSHLGLLTAKIENKKDISFLTNIQEDLCHIMASLAGANQEINYLNVRVSEFEHWIDIAESQLPKIHKFIIPQGTEISAFFHIARTVCRRAERNLVKYINTLKVENLRLKIILKYLNRLSDLLFIMARKYNI